MRIDLFEAFGLDPNIITILKGKYGELPLAIQERAFREYQILNSGNCFISNYENMGGLNVRSGYGFVSNSYANQIFDSNYYIKDSIVEITPALSQMEMSLHIPNHVASEIYRKAVKT